MGLQQRPSAARHDAVEDLLEAHFGAIAATDFFTVEVLTFIGLVRYVVLFVIDFDLAASTSPAWSAVTHAHYIEASTAAALAATDKTFAAFAGRQKPRRSLVRMAGLEPARCYPLVPETSASTNSATFAYPSQVLGGRYRCHRWSRITSAWCGSEWGG